MTEVSVASYQFETLLRCINGIQTALERLSEAEEEREKRAKTWEEELKKVSAALVEFFKRLEGTVGAVTVGAR